jgi:hypothetical protein
MFASGVPEKVLIVKKCRQMKKLMIKNIILLKQV